MLSEVTVISVGSLYHHIKAKKKKILGQMMYNHITSYRVSQVSKIFAEPVSLVAHNFLVEIISPWKLKSTRE